MSASTWSSRNAVSSGRLETPSLAKIAFMWSLRVCLEMSLRDAVEVTDTTLAIGGFRARMGGA
ncbi:MAG TPA: hypothetical protein VLW50_16750 [Streptosporangiaceae bacterium]|nr:hypothetical protein [Streptosporangiaceae bacterium]